MAANVDKLTAGRPGDRLMDYSAIWNDAGRRGKRASKLTSLAAAIERHVRPGMHLHMTTGVSRAAASFYELMRQFRGKRPDFTISSVSMAGPSLAAIEAGLVTRLITSYHGDIYPTPGPNPIVQRAWAGGALEIQEWTVLTMAQRLWAGAMGLPFIPTRSLRGSTMVGNRPDVFELDGQLMLTALVPDLTLVHAPAADKFGNTIFGAPYGDAALGAWAARDGVIVTAEKIVSEDEVTAHAEAVRLPDSRVLAVVEAPYGAHPGALLVGGVADLDPGYYQDDIFMAEFRNACRNPEVLAEWLDRWIWNIDHDAYVGQLGEDRMHDLRRRSSAMELRKAVGRRVDELALPAEPTEPELAIVAGARAIAALAMERQHQTILAGVGVANLAASLARCKIAAGGRSVDLLVEMGLYGFLPAIGDPSLVSNAVARTATMRGGILDILGATLAHTSCLGVLGAAEIDETGNINSTLGSHGGLLVGSGGANDVGSTADAVVVVLEQSQSRFRPEVAYVTAPGARVHAVATQVGLYEKDEAGKLILTAAYPPVGPSVKAARELCGWDLRVAEQLSTLPLPTTAELHLLRSYDPDRYFVGRRAASGISRSANESVSASPTRRA
jgi:acyl CoA:acetate/3-ketoacid CoA transferase alpha subunit/acyl CoA:acetate/3-ketoacid CoA transferase beta subunit